MKALNKLTLALVVTLAINFVGLIVAAGMVAQKSGLNGDKIEELKAVLFPPPAEPELEEEVEPDEPTPMEELLAMLDAQSGKPAADRVASFEHELDARNARLARQKRELADRMRLLDTASNQLATDRDQLAEQVTDWEERRTTAEARLTDEGFLTTLRLYESLPAAQAKKVIAGLDEEIALAFLKAMEPRTAGKILREFDGDDETEQLRRLLEGMRQGVAAGAQDPDADPITAGWTATDDSDLD